MTTVFERVTASPEALADFVVGMMILAVAERPTDWEKMRRQQLDGLRSEVTGGLRHE